MRAAEHAAVLFETVPDDPHAAMRAGGCERMNRAFEGIERVRTAVFDDLKCLVVIIAAGFTGSHDIHLHLWRGSNRSTPSH